MAIDESTLTKGQLLRKLGALRRYAGDELGREKRLQRAVAVQSLCCGQHKDCAARSSPFAAFGTTRKDWLERN